MIALEISGMVEVRVGSGIFFFDNSKQKRGNKQQDCKIVYTTLELIEVHKEIEGTNAALASQRIDSKILKIMEKAIDKMLKDDLNGCDSDSEFYLLVAKATGNRVLDVITDYLWQQQQDSPMQTKLIDLMKENKFDNIIFDDHRNLLNSLSRKDLQQEQKIMYNQLNHARDIYFDIIGDDEDWAIILVNTLN